MTRQTSRLRQFAISAALLAVLAPRAAAAVPGIINFQGRLLDSNKLPRNGTFSMTFSVCDALSGGSCALWTETRSVVVTNGVFAVQLGANTPLAPSVFTSDVRYLEISVAGETLSPRERLVTGPYAFRSGEAEALAADPADCSLPNVALGVNAAGTAQCSQPSNVTGNAATASALAADGTNAGSGLLCRGVDASGNCEEAAVDASAVSGSTNPVQSGAMSTALAGKLDDTAIVTKQGNTFNGASQLVQLDGTTQLPAVSGALVTGLNASNVNAGTLATAYGGTGVNTFASNGVLYGNAAGAVLTTAQGGANTVLTANAGAPAFSATPTITSLTLGAGSPLSAYLENQTCNMTIAGTTSAGAGTYTYNVCRYTQIGKFVNLQWSVATTAHTGTGSFRFDGLPVAGLNVASFNQHCVVGWSATTFAAGTGLKGYIAPNSTSITVVNTPATNTAEAAVAIDATTTLRVNCHYMTN